MPNSATIVNLPKLDPSEYTQDNEFARAIATKIRVLRLYALRVASEAFASSYEEEVQKDLTQTLERLKTASADHFFALDLSRTVPPWTPETSDEFFKACLEADWLGSIVLIGPLAPSGSAAISAKQDPLSLLPVDGRGCGLITAEKGPSELSYHLNGVFVDPQARMAGLGRALLEEAVAKGGKEASRRGLNLHCTVLVDSGNSAARRLYEKSGFRTTGEETYVQQPRMRLGESKTEERVAIRMELLQQILR